MYFFRKIFILPVILFLGYTCTAQQQQKIYSFKQIGWTVELPADFLVIDSAENTARMERGAKAMEDANDIKADISETITLIGATKNKYNYFNAAIEPFDSKGNISWKTSNQQLKELLYKTFAEKMKDAKIDSASNNEVIDGLSFDKFRITVTIDDKVLFNSFLLSKLYKGYDFGISYLYLDERTKDQIESMLRNSKFSK
jgi:hypothetical protein